MKDKNKDYLCPKCKIGKETYRLDLRSSFCPYICFYNGDKCSIFKPMTKSNKNER